MTLIKPASRQVSDASTGMLRLEWDAFFRSVASRLSNVEAIGGLTPADGAIIVGDGSTWVAESGATARSSLGLAIGADVQAHDADLDALAGLSTTGLIARTGAGTAAARTLTAGNGIAISNGDGVSGNPTISHAGVTGIYRAEDYGVSTSNDAAANTTALDSLISTATSAGGGTIMLPRGTIQLNALSAITCNNIVLQGTGCFSGGTTLQAMNATGDCITFNGCQFSGVRDVWMIGGVRRASGTAITFTTSCFQCFAERVNINYHYVGITVTGCTETILHEISLRYLLNVWGILFTGTVSYPSYRMVIDDIRADNPYPGDNNGTRKSWTATTAFSLNDIISSNGNIYQCTTAGTSGSSAPSGIPGTGASDAFTTAITDGSAAWKFVSSSSLSWIIQDNYAYSLVVEKSALIDGYCGFLMTDSANTGSSYPIWAKLDDLECDHNYYGGVILNNGSGVYIVNSWLGSGLTGNGLTVGASYLSELYVGAGTRIMGNYQHGALINGGVTHTIDGCHIGANSQGGSGTYHGIVVASDINRFSITGNMCGQLAAEGNPQGWGILISAGTSDHYVISGNVCYNNVTGGVTDGGTGVNKSVTGNVT